MFVAAWAVWVCVGWLWLGAVLSAALIGKPREPYTPFTAICNFLIAGAALMAALTWM